MFQFDAGTYAQTLDREGEAILNVAGNVQAAVDFVVSMVRRSRYIEGVDTEEEALAWMNEVRPWNDLFHPWIQTVTHYYNGCVPGRCSVYESRYESYTNHCNEMLEEMGSDFWYGVDDACGPIPAMGAIVEETDACFVAGGPSRYWRPVMQGHGDGLLWTNATDNDNPANYAVWHLSFVEPGRYVIEAYTDGRWAESRQTGYRVTHAGGTEVVRVDQTAIDGFQVVGTFEFGAGEGQQVRIDDNTGEPNGDEIAIVADALRITPENVTPMEPVDPMEPMEPVDPPSFMPDASVRPLPDGGCTVGAGSPGSQSSLSWWALIGALVVARRSHRYSSR